MNTIRLATAADLALVTACVQDAYAKYVARIGRRPAPMDAEYADLIAQGVVHLLCGPTTEAPYGIIVTRAVPGALFVDNVAVQLSRQGQGFGRQLMAFAENRANARGLPEIRLYTNAKMTENVAFYARLGYSEVGRRMDDGYDRVFMRKRLTR